MKNKLFSLVLLATTLLMTAACSERSQFYAHPEKSLPASSEQDPHSQVLSVEKAEEGQTLEALPQIEPLDPIVVRLENSSPLSEGVPSSLPASALAKQTDSAFLNGNVPLDEEIEPIAPSTPTLQMGSPEISRPALLATVPVSKNSDFSNGALPLDEDIEPVTPVMAALSIPLPLQISTPNQLPTIAVPKTSGDYGNIPLDEDLEQLSPIVTALKIPELPSVALPSSLAPVPLKEIESSSPEAGGWDESDLPVEFLSDAKVAPTEANQPASKEKFQESFKQLSNKQAVDILWIVDNSPTMLDEQISLGENFDKFIANFDLKNIDFRMAITTTDARLHRKDFVVWNSMKLLNTQNSKEDPQAFMENFKKMIKVGVKGSGIETGLTSMSNFIDSHGKDFLRDDAYLVVIIVTDEDDQSAHTVKDYARFLRSTKEDAKKIKVFSIVDVESKSPAQKAFISGHARYKQFSDLTGGEVLDIKKDFQGSLKFIGESVKDLMGSFKLSQIPEENSIKVQINGRKVEKSAYKLEKDMILFHPGNEPEEGSDINVEYTGTIQQN